MARRPWTRFMTYLGEMRPARNLVARQHRILPLLNLLSLSVSMPKCKVQSALCAVTSLSTSPPYIRFDTHEGLKVFP